MKEKNVDLKMKLDSQKVITAAQVKLLESVKKELDELKQSQKRWDSKHRELSVALDKKDGIFNAAQARVEGLEKEAIMMNQKVAQLHAERKQAEAREMELQVLLIDD